MYFDVFVEDKNQIEMGDANQLFAVAYINSSTTRCKIFKKPMFKW